MLTKSNLQTTLWAMIAAFATYSCMYAYRKPISAATYEDYVLFGLNYKVVIIIIQVLGYLCSKFIGIKFISELKQKKRAIILISLIAISNFALFLFAVTPFPYNFIWIFFNGLPLGFVWGIVFSYIEGRKVTDILATFLSISFIVSSGLVKSVGRWVIEIYHISEFWMPFAVGTLFIPLMLLSIWMLEQIPLPDKEDFETRAPRVALNSIQRKNLFNTYLLGFIAILLANMFLTVGRDIKDNFLVEIFKSMGIADNLSIYLKTETIIGIIVLGMLSLLVLVQKNRKAFLIIHLIMILGLLIMLFSTLAIQYKIGNKILVIIFHGIGLYTAYIVFQSLYFERFIATFKVSGNVGFLIYMSDFIGYLASCTILVLKELTGFSAQWDIFFIQLSYFVGIFGIISVVSAYFYFKNKPIPS